jgi:hypothetical protein
MHISEFIGQSVHCLVTSKFCGVALFVSALLHFIEKGALLHIYGALISSFYCSGYMCAHVLPGVELRPVLV